MKIEKNEKALCIIAHPDDETIWMGGTILRNNQADWTIFSLCRANDKDRAPKFKRVCDYYGAKSIMTNLDDDNDIELNEVVKMAKEIIKEKLKDKNFDYIFTHGENGEYGHNRHVAVYEAIKELLEENFLINTKAYYLNYKKKNDDEEFSEMIPKEDSTELIKLTDEEYDRKKNEVMVDIYGFDINGPDANYCTRIEAFIE
ncbi:PIG-L family deacetylase [Candidatus Parcubacteria bacterium]|nr:PIG-L family deacetylase [Candidatus Parcubacteria bacterium]